MQFFIEGKPVAFPKFMGAYGERADGGDNAIPRFLTAFIAQNTNEMQDCLEYDGVSAELEFV